MFFCGELSYIFWVWLPPRSNRFSSMDPLPEAFHQAIPGLSSNAQYSTTRQPGGGVYRYESLRCTNIPSTHTWDLRFFCVCVFFFKPGPIPIAFSWNSRYPLSWCISKDFDHGDVIKATASYRYVGGCQKVGFFNKKSTSTMAKWHFQGPYFFWFQLWRKSGWSSNIFGTWIFITSQKVWTNRTSEFATFNVLGPAANPGAQWISTIELFILM